MDAGSWSTGILGNSIQTTRGFHLTRQKQHDTLSVHSNKNPSSWRLIKNQLKFTPWFKAKLCLGAHSNVLFLEDHLYIKNQIVDITTICKRWMQKMMQWSPQSPSFGILIHNENVKIYSSHPSIPGTWSAGKWSNASSPERRALNSQTWQKKWSKERKKTFGVFLESSGSVFSFNYWVRCCRLFSKWPLWLHEEIPASQVGMQKQLCCPEHGVCQCGVTEGIWIKHSLWCSKI